MTRFRIEPAADRRIDEIVAYTRDHWGDAKAVEYVDSLFAELEAIASRAVPWTAIPASFEVTGYRRLWRSHVIYWQAVGDQIAVVAILHQRMHQFDRLRDAMLGGP